MPLGTIYLIPTFLHEDALEVIAPYVLDAVKNCTVFFVENEKSARRYLKKLWPQMVIDKYEWYTIHKVEWDVHTAFENHLKEGKNIAIISEAGCPGVADPGQVLIGIAQQMGVIVKPLVGPSSILLALMASGMNGQQFQFNGYLPIDNLERKGAIKHLENYSAKTQCTQIFIETPYRNNQVIKEILSTCKDTTKLCIAVDITAPSESIKTKTIAQWKKEIPEIHKRLAIFLLMA